MEDSIPRLLLLIVLILASALFAAAETSFSYCNNVRLRLLAEEGNKKAKRVVWISDHFDRLVVTLLIAINILHVVAASIATVLAVQIMGNTGSVIATIVLTIVIFLFSENIPKNIARVNADSFSMAISLPMIWLIYLLWPFATLFIFIGEGVKKIMKVQKDEPSLTEDEFTDIVENLEEENVIEPEDTEIIKSAVEFGDRTVLKVMTPFNKMSAVPYNASKDELKRILLEEKYSRFPVYRGNIHNIVGVIQASSVLHKMANNIDFDMRDIITKPYFVTPNTEIKDVFSGMGRRRTHIAIVRNDDKVIGLISMEDILEEIVGEIYDEDDEAPLEIKKEAKK